MHSLTLCQRTRQSTRHELRRRASFGRKRAPSPRDSRCGRGRCRRRGHLYFHDKSDLLIAISIRALEQLAERFSAVIAQPISGRAQAEACGRAYVTFAKEFPVRFDVLAHFEAHSPSGELDPAYEQFLSIGERPQSMLTVAIVTGIRDGSIRKEIGDPVLLGFTLWGLMHGIIQLTVRKIGGLQRAGISAEQLIEQAFRFAIDAMSPDSPATAQASGDLRSAT
ncbi:MAG: WHG domain-containing protein [Gammaproteobacteria bacterium]|nr:WHG domain-containing protein [Gammaproteobacteria bacterium]